MRKGIGKLWHEIGVNASYSHMGSYDRWMPLRQIIETPYWEEKSDEEICEMLDELVYREKIKVNFFEWQVRIAPDVAKKEMKSREAMKVVVENWERNGSSFTYGT
jgi:hypothetical protein